MRTFFAAGAFAVALLGQTMGASAEPVLEVKISKTASSECVSAIAGVVSRGDPIAADALLAGKKPDRGTVVPNGGLTLAQKKDYLERLKQAGCQ
jgi:hypothetical protein